MATDTDQTRELVALQETIKALRSKLDAEREAARATQQKLAQDHKIAMRELQQTIQKLRDQLDAAQ
ncbi:MAG: hypothetical protein ACPG1C_02595 [Alphaproteobacteria bacterium]